MYYFNTLSYLIKELSTKILTAKSLSYLVLFIVYGDEAVIDITFMYLLVHAVRPIYR